MAICLLLQEYMVYAVIAIGPEIMLAILPISLDGKDQTCSNVWLIPILKGTTIHATIRAGFVSDFDKILEENADFMISNFSVKRNVDGTKLTPHQYKLHFLKKTNVRHCENFTCDNDDDCLKLLSFHDFNNTTFDTTYAFDVIGRLINNKDITVVNGKNGSNKSSLEFELQDLKGETIRCILWNDLGEKLHKYIKDNENSKEPIIVLIIMAKYSTWNSVTQVSNCFFGTKVLINENIPQITDFKTRFLGTEFATSEDTKIELSTNTVFKNPEESYTKFPVKNIDELIKVQIRVQDETGSASFWLFQPEICKLIGKSPGYLISKAKKDLDNASYPEDLNIMLNKHYVLKVQVSGYNLENNYHIFTANKITDDEDVMKSILAKRTIHKETHAICEDQNTHPKDENVDEEKNLNCDDEDTYSEVGGKRKNNGGTKQHEHWPTNLHQNILNEEHLHEVPVKASAEYKKAYKTEIPAESNCKGISKAYIDIGDPIHTCKTCKAKLWTAEAKKGNKKVTEDDTFTLCSLKARRNKKKYRRKIVKLQMKLKKSWMPQIL
ncbi:hypothetical protein CTI12_AA052650 [Artemisia annua]|uniref:Replication protein A 70 kDa DNA-binding subunit B/D first OB fold domain-containing protein n=1 Tax=Artemisia annua TaxID=35608 RepID=A0A2U1QAS8_ARTAN|nr:hypothetical protein CTI12_AA052650 [Artemisia annua]